MGKEKKLPLCVDLDGTLIRTDVTQESVFLFLRKYPWKFFYILYWLCKGRAFLKAKLSENVMFNPKLLPYNQDFLNYLKVKAKEGHDVYLVTAADQKCAKIVYDYLGIFKEYLASNGDKNLRSSTKAQALCDLFDSEGFIYAGNSKHDLPVWDKAGEIIAVNTPKRVLREINTVNKKIERFQDKKLTLKDIGIDFIKSPWFTFQLILNALIILGNFFFNKILLEAFNVFEHISFISFLFFFGAAASLVGQLFALEEMRCNGITNSMLLATGHLTIPSAVYLSIFFITLGVILGLFLPQFYDAFVISLFIIQFGYVGRLIRAKT